MQNIGGEVPYQADNPTDGERYEMLRYLLKTAGREEDFENVIDVLNPPPDILTICPKSKGKGMRVAVIGAGESGLAAALELRKIGCDITIFEASARVGGRVYTRICQLKILYIPGLKIQGFFPG